jgi:hypothetical protein
VHIISSGSSCETFQLFIELGKLFRVGLIEFGGKDRLHIIADGGYHLIDGRAGTRLVEGAYSRKASVAGRACFVHYLSIDGINE